MLLHPPQDLGAVDLADDDVLRAHAGDCVEHTPPIAVELRQRVQVHVAVVDAQVPAEDCGVEPYVAMRELYTLRTGRGAAGVVDGRRGVLVVRPGCWFGVRCRRIGFAADDELELAFHLGHGRFQFGIDHQDTRAAVLHDVLHLFRRQTEVDRDEYAT